MQTGHNSPPAAAQAVQNPSRSILSEDSDRSPVPRYAARYAGSAEICWTVYCYLGGQQGFTRADYRSETAMPHGKVCYLEIPAITAEASADF